MGVGPHEPIDDICDFIERYESAERADFVYERIKETVLKLEAFPKRGRLVPELKGMDLTEYREVLFKPYRILYFVSGKRVYVHCIVDGRRDLDDVLSRRFLR